MDAVEFLKQFNRMCNTYIYGGCTECPAYKYRCGDEFDEQEEDGVSIVEQWSKEHPVKTRQSELLKMFPSALIADGLLCICPRTLDPKTYSTDTGCSHIGNSITCRDCRRNFWLKEIE